MTHNFGVGQIQATFSTMAFSGPCSPAVSWRTQIRRFFWVLVCGVELKGYFWSPFQQMFSLQWMWNSQFYLQMVIWCDLCWWHRLLTSSYEQGLLHPSSRTKMLQNRVPFAQLVQQLAKYHFEKRQENHTNQPATPIYSSGLYTLPKFNIAPEKLPSQ